MPSIREVIPSQDEWETDSEQEEEAEEDIDFNELELEKETFLERIFALKDMIPLKTRLTFQRWTRRCWSKINYTSRVTGHILWIVATTSIILLLPFSMEYDRDLQLSNSTENQNESPQSLEEYHRQLEKDQARQML